MNEFQIKLWTELMELASETDAFYFQDFDFKGRHFRIFNYRMASYSDFMKPSALECRGHMFEIDEVGNVIRLACLPQQKFFNLNEMSSDISILAEALIKNGRLSRDVYERAKTKN